MQDILSAEQPDRFLPQPRHPASRTKQAKCDQAESLNTESDKLSKKGTPREPPTPANQSKPRAGWSDKRKAEHATRMAELGLTYR
ncbi:hypothetical protein EYZ11_003605 [Aspergillus tanneri]|uniref:Uncharacterized protein n=1 Tax=Aspergillus tanneri TaxID=1220188 RepID=A0A4S3JPZ2_9EURO|nr:uncharacterized protein ATNIH1004_006553 [Aspergillus tanneri]KAA8647851.1 hypothetical protein ATNIH1004_006553 [Aspergillus tanneri]THC96888.1 hypothetical protein EYZ11_003605 [Aspergillus tanneri]